jgi:hypothetical protein
MNHIKYPRTLHLPWSPGATSDDVCLTSVNHFLGKQIIVTEKMDRENTTLYSDGCHARSLDSRYHPSREWIRALQGRIGQDIPEGWRICGENLYAKHSVAYDCLPSFFLVFSVWNADNVCLSWKDTLDWIALLGLCSVPVLYQGVFDEQYMRDLTLDLTKQEGYVVRLADAYSFEIFSQSVAKWVRPGHVQTDQHWMAKAVEKNNLAR